MCVCVCARVGVCVCVWGGGWGYEAALHASEPAGSYEIPWLFGGCNLIVA